MKILVTGASGYIGNRLIEVLLETDWVSFIIGTDVKESTVQHSKFIFYQKDIRDSFDDIFEKEQIDAIVHLAYVLAPIHNKVLMEDINKNGTRNILDTAVKWNIKYLLYTSSTTAYGFHPDNDQPLTEDKSPLRGNEDFTYAKNKKEIESIFADFSSKHPELPIGILRPCFVVGPGFKNAMAQHLQKKNVILPTKTYPFQFVHEDDLIDLMALMLQKYHQGIYNVAADGTMSFSEMVTMLGNKEVNIPWFWMYHLNNLAWNLRITSLSQAPSAGFRCAVTPWISSNEKVKKELDFKFQYDTKAAFQNFADYVKNKANK